MIVAVDIGFQQVAYKEEECVFIAEVFKRMAAKHTDSTFLFVSHNNFQIEKFSVTNAIDFQQHSSSSFFKRKWWYSVKLPLLLKQNNVDLLLSFDTVNAVKTIKPQYLVLPDYDYVLTKGAVGKRLLNKLQSVHKIVVAAFSKDKLIEQLPALAVKTVELPAAGTNTFPVTIADKEDIKEVYTKGREYFVYPGSCNKDSNLLTVLKAFSLFKQRQKSNMQLVLFAAPAKAMLQKLDSYKHREDVILVSEEKQAVKDKLMAAAYAMVYPSLYDGYCLPVLQAMQYGAPVITRPSTALAAYAAEAALYANVDDQKEIAEQMMLIYKDEPLRNKLIAMGKERVKQYNWDITAESLWQLITMPE